MFFKNSEKRNNPKTQTLVYRHYLFLNCILKNIDFVRKNNLIITRNTVNLINLKKLFKDQWIFNEIHFFWKLKNSTRNNNKNLSRISEFVFRFSWNYKIYTCIFFDESEVDIKKDLQKIH